MEVIVNDQPCLLTETLSLVHAWFNDIRLEELTVDNDPCCIPAAELRQIQQEVCGDLDMQDEELRFYFKGIPIKTKAEKSISSLAFNLLHTGQTHLHFRVSDAIAALKESWRGGPKYFHVSGMDVHGLRIEATEQFTSLATEIGKLPVPQDYQLKLVDGYARFETHLDRLEEILTPLAEKLQPLLMPWVERTASRRQEWREFLASEGAMEWIWTLCDLAHEKIEKLTLTTYYLTAMHGGGHYHSPPLELCLYLGVAFQPGRLRDRGNSPLNDGEYTALRLLTRQECVDIFRTTREKPKCIQDLAQELNMNPGTVFRNVNSMFNVGLLKLEIISGRNYYWANIPRMEKMTEHLVRYLKEI